MHTKRSRLPPIIIIGNIFSDLGRNGEYFFNYHTMMTTPMQTAYTNFPQQAGDHFQPQPPIDVPIMMMDDLMVSNLLQLPISKC